MKFHNTIKQKLKNTNLKVFKEKNVNFKNKSIDLMYSRL